VHCCKVDEAARDIGVDKLHVDALTVYLRNRARFQSLTDSGRHRHLVIMQRMEINRETTAPIPQAAATVLMLRDGDQGPEAFLVRRHEKSNVHGGVYVFPGGKVDDDDFSYPAGHLDQDALALKAALNEAETDARTAAGIYVAAIRETFEECGVLLARGNHSAVAAGGMVFSQAVRENELTLCTADLLPWSRWITPTHSITPGRRFDTRFFVLRAPPDQAARHDDRETIDSVWLTPREALERYWRGEIALVPPQIMSLSHIASHASVDSVLREARSRPPYLICPAVHEIDGLRVMAYPSDPLHPSPGRVMPGPTRLTVRHGRLEPPGGFDGFFG
jgi:8-oxo-dGTP pyrophosphatase MutT (NUDIX family)